MLSLAIFPALKLSQTEKHYESRDDVYCSTNNTLQEVLQVCIINPTRLAKKAKNCSSRRENSFFSSNHIKGNVHLKGNTKEWPERVQELEVLSGQRATQQAYLLK